MEPYYTEQRLYNTLNLFFNIHTYIIYLDTRAKSTVIHSVNVLLASVQAIVAETLDLRNLFYNCFMPIACRQLYC